MFCKKSDKNCKDVLEGVKLKTLVHGDKTSMHQFILKKGATIPVHKHSHEQTGFMVSGQMNFNIGGEKFVAETGDSWSIPGDMEHSVYVIEDAVVVEVFSPVREDYLK